MHSLCAFAVFSVVVQMLEFSWHISAVDLLHMVVVVEEGKRGWLFINWSTINWWTDIHEKNEFFGAIHTVYACIKCNLVVLHICRNSFAIFMCLYSFMCYKYLMEIINEDYSLKLCSVNFTYWRLMPLCVTCSLLCLILDCLGRQPLFR